MSEYSKLRGRIVEKFGSQRAFAKKIGLSEQSVTAKLSGRTDFSTNEILEWCNKLGIEQTEVGIYFFDKDFQKVKVIGG